MQELESEMTETANPDHADMVGRMHIQLHKRIENRDPAAEERTGGHWIKFFRQRQNPLAMSANPIRKSTEAADDRAFHGWAEIVIARHALLADSAGMRVPTQAHPAGPPGDLSPAPRKR